MRNVWTDFGHHTLEGWTTGQTEVVISQTKTVGRDRGYGGKTCRGRLVLVIVEG
jgi:hypothetical protein